MRVLAPVPVQSLKFVRPALKCVFLDVRELESLIPETSRTHLAQLAFFRHDAPAAAGEKYIALQTQRSSLHLRCTA